MSVWTSMFGTLLVIVATFLVARFVFGLQAKYEGYSFADEAIGKNNAAVMLRLCGLLVGLIAATIGAYQPEGLFTADLASAAQAMTGALVALVISRYVNDKVILSAIDNNTAVVKDQNVAVAIVEFSTFLATACIFIGGMADPEHGFIYNIAWFAIGQAFLIVIAFLYAQLFPGVFAKIAEGSTACALTLAGFLLSGGLAVGAAIRGSSESLVVDLVNVGLSLVAWVIVMVVVRGLVFVVVPPSRYRSEIVEDNNWCVGFIDGLLSVTVTAGFVYVHGIL